MQKVKYQFLWRMSVLQWMQLLSCHEPVDHNEYNFMAEKSEIITYHAKIT